MARLVTLQTMQTRALQRAAMQYGSSTNSIAGVSTGQPSGELTDCLNEGLAELWTMLGDVDGQPYYLQSVTFNTNSVSDTYAIGPGQTINITDFWKPCGFDIQWGQNIVLTARPFMWAERNRYKYIPAWQYSYPIYYRMLGKPTGSANAALDSVKFIPQPSGAFQITMWYLPTPPVLANLTDTFDGIMGFEEYAILSAARKMLLRQEQLEHANNISALMAEEKDRILGSIMTRDAAEPERVTDVTLGNQDSWAPVY